MNRPFVFVSPFLRHPSAGWDPCCGQTVPMQAGERSRGLMDRWDDGENFLSFDQQLPGGHPR
jgi:hypothetical protein